MKISNHYLILCLMVSIGLSSCVKEPVASFTVSKTEVAPNELIYFNNTSQNAESYQWDFGDFWNFFSGTSTAENPSYIYSVDGVYTVTLTVYSKKEKKQDQTSITIVVVEECADCTYTILGITSSPEEFCGDELEAAEDSGWDCD